MRSNHFCQKFFCIYCRFLLYKALMNCAQKKAKISTQSLHHMSFEYKLCNLRFKFRLSELCWLPWYPAGDSHADPDRLTSSPPILVSFSLTPTTGCCSLLAWTSTAWSLPVPLGGDFSESPPDDPASRVAAIPTAVRPRWRLVLRSRSDSRPMALTLSYPYQASISFIVLSAKSYEWM